MRSSTGRSFIPVGDVGIEGEGGLSAEFAERTASGPIRAAGGPRNGGLAKARTAWSVVVALVTTMLLLGAGFAIGLGFPDAHAVADLTRPALGVLAVLTAAPAGWASTVGRGLLPGIAAAVGILVAAQIFELAGAGIWFPIVAPAFWAMSSPSPAWPLLLMPLVPLVFGAATIAGWQRLQLDR